MMRISKYTTNLFLLSVPLSQYVSARLLVIAAVVSLVMLVRGGKALRRIGGSWEILFYFLTLLFGILYSDDSLTAFRVIETSLGLIGLMIVFGPDKARSKESLRSAVVAFTLGVFLASLICLSNSVYHYYLTGDVNVFFYYNLTGIIGSQPTYFAYYLIAILTYWLFAMFYDSNWQNMQLLGMSILLVFFFLVLLLSGGRTTLVSILLLFSFFILKYIIDVKLARRTLVMVLVGVMLGAVLGFNVLQSNKADWSDSHDYWERAVLWESALDANPNPMLGVGTGDYKRVLNSYYHKHGLEAFAEASYNSHNQYIQIYFSNGIVGLVALLILLSRPLYLSFVGQNILGLMLIFPFLIYGITEVFLGRYQGVVFFAMLHQICVTSYYITKPGTVDVAR